MRHIPDCFSFPFYNSARRIFQPDYELWQSVAVGMTRKEVIAILGRPLRDPYLSPQPRYSVYGYLQMPMMPRIRTYRFYIRYDDDARVAGKADPFGGIFSVDGKPSKPVILAPSQGAAFQHFPRIVDMRWHPASGQYPIWYEIAIGHGSPVPPEKGLYRDEIHESEHSFPYYVSEFPGSCPGRFKVRGINSLGKGEWSDFRYFDFTQARRGNSERRQNSVFHPQTSTAETPDQLRRASIPAGG